MIQPGGVRSLGRVHSPSSLLPEHAPPLHMPEGPWQARTLSTGGNRGTARGTTLHPCLLLQSGMEGRRGISVDLFFCFTNE